MRDPVTGYDYPESWVQKCNDPQGIAEARAGRAVLCSDGTVLRRGYSTGTTASAACKAAIISYSGPVEKVEVLTNCGITLEVPVKACDGRAECRKFSGDYPDDVTAGITIVAVASPSGNGITIRPGRGIGI